MRNKVLAWIIQAFVLLVAVMVTTPATAGEVSREKVWASAGNVLNQGIKPTCVGNSWQAWLEGYPSPRPGLVADFIYTEAKKVDIIPGEDYDGTTSEAGAEVLRHRGYIEEYHVTKDVNEMIDWLMDQGPIILSMPWHREEDGSEVEIDGYHTGQGNIRGWHSVYCYGYREPHPTRDGFECQNSWGRAWGDDGVFWIHERDVRRLASHGLLDAVLAVKVGR